MAAYKMRDLLSQKNGHDFDADKQHSKTQGKARSSSKYRNYRETQKKNVNVQAQEAEEERETESLIDRMRGQASNGNIPEYGKTIIDVLMHYQGKNE